MSGMHKVLVIALVVILGWQPLARANGAIVSMDETARHAGTCTHYWNRAWSRPRDRDVSFVTLMAEACRMAFDTLAHGDPAGQRASLGFLRRLTQFRLTITEMNIAKYRRFRHREAPAARAMESWQVTEAGEVLIARSFGVMAAFDAWLDSSPGFTLAAR